MGVRHSCRSSQKDLFMTSTDIIAQSTYRARKDLFIAFSPNYKKKLRGLEIKITTFIICSLSQTLFFKAVCMRVCVRVLWMEWM